MVFMDAVQEVARLKKEEDRRLLMVASAAILTNPGSGFDLRKALDDDMVIRAVSVAEALLDEVDATIEDREEVAR
jgi:hypothetical protein